MNEPEQRIGDSLARAHGTGRPEVKRNDSPSDLLESLMPQSAAAKALLLAAWLLLMVCEGYAGYKVGFWEFIKLQGAMGWLIIWTSALGLALTFFTFFVLLAVVRLGRRKTVVVFVSYPHELAPVAKAIAEHLDDGTHTRVRFIPFRERTDQHDEVISEVRQFLIESDVVVAVPANRSGFFESEILAASVLERPVMLIAVEGSFHLPDTAYSGYPVLSHSRLVTSNFLPLRKLVQVATDSRAAVDDIKWDILRQVGWDLVVGYALLVIGSVVLMPIWEAVLALSLSTLWAIGRADLMIEIIATGKNGLLWLLLVVVPALLLLRSLWMFRSRSKLRSAIRLKMGTRSLGNTELVELLTDGDSLAGVKDCIWPARVRHSLPLDKPNP
jgi:hypothetical protein